MEPGRIGLAEAVRALRSELAEAMAEGEGQPVRLHVESVNLEMHVEIASSREGGAGVQFWVVSADGRTSQSNTSAHTVSLQLSAETETGERTRLGRGRPALRD